MDDGVRVVSELNQRAWSRLKDHLDSLTRGDPMPSDVTPTIQEAIDAVPLDFQRNLAKLEELFTSFLDVLRTTTLQDLRQRTGAAYGSAVDAEGSVHLL